MVKKTIKYTDYNDVEREEDFYFNLSVQELIDAERTDPSGSFAKKIEGIVKSQSSSEILSILEWIVRKSYGIRTNDGRVFKKTEEATEEFLQSAAYEEFYLSFLNDPESAAKFINEVTPKKLPNGLDLMALKE